MFLDVTLNKDNANEIELIIFAEEWTFTSANLCITGGILCVLVVVYIMLQRYQVQRKCEVEGHKDEC